MKKPSTVNSLGALSEAIQAAGERRRSHLGSEAGVPQMYFVIDPSSGEPFYGGLKYLGGKFVPVWHAGTDECNLALFTSVGEARQAAKDYGGTAISLNINP